MKKVLALLLTLTLVIGCLAACSKDDNNGSNGSGNNNTTNSDKPYSEREELTIEIYDKAANYQGVQEGWFAQVVKERFNIKLNIIAPQVAGDAIYQTRVSTGNLGDIVILDQNEFNDCLSQGLIKDITAEYKNSQYL